MKIPAIRGTIDRRILVNFRVDPTVLANVLPPPFRPKLINGWGMAGICLIRLKYVRPWFFPKAFGIGSENAAHRIAVEWEQDGELQEGVFVPRRDTSSRLNTLVGGRLFPGVHHHARFQVNEKNDYLSLVLNSDDAKTHLTFAGHTVTDMPTNSVFKSVEQASDFFQRGSLGYSTTGKVGEFDGLELHTFNWSIQPLEVENVESNYFQDTSFFPPGSIEFDSALLMTDIEHEWHAREPIRL